MVYFSKNQLPVAILSVILILLLISSVGDIFYLLILLLVGVIAGYLIWNHLRWNKIEELNRTEGITRKNTYIDQKGYLRWRNSDRLCHREIAWNSNKRGKEAFGTSDIHHIDGNKFNNRPENLMVLSRADHQMEHGQLIEFDGQKFRKVCHKDKIYRMTNRAIMIANTWIPRSQTVIQDDYIYIPERLYNEKGFG